MTWLSGAAAQVDVGPTPGADPAINEPFREGDFGRWKARFERPGGRLVLIDFEREPGLSRPWVLSHVRAGKEVFAEEIRQVGFRFEGEADLMQQNYLLTFRKPLTHFNTGDEVAR